MRPPEALENSLVTTVVHSHTFKHQPGNVNDALPPFPLSKQQGIFTYTILSPQHISPHPSPFWIPFLSSPDISKESHNPHVWRLETRKQTFLLGNMSSFHTCQPLCGCPFFQHFCLLSCPGKNGLDGWQGKSFQPQETSGMSGGSWMHPVPAAPR